MPRGALDIDVSFDARRLSDHLTAMQREVVPAALMSAINKVAKQGRTAAVRDIARAKGMKQKVIKRRIRLHKQASKVYPVAILRLFTRAVLAHELGDPRQMKKGAAVGRHRFPGAFVARSPYFSRVASKYGPAKPTMVVYKRAPGAKRLPIYWQSVPLEPGATEAMRRAVRQTVDQKFPQVFAHELNWRLQKMPTRYARRRAR